MSLADPTSPFDQGLALHQAGRLDEAQLCYEQQLAIQPDHLDARHLLGAISLQAGRFEEGVAAIERALEIGPPNAMALSNLGMGLIELRRFEEAAEASRQALQLDPANVGAHTNLGNALMGLGDGEAAIASYEAGLAAGPGYAAGYYNLGAALSALGRLDEALSNFDWALALNPDLIEAHINRGGMLDRLGRPSEALVSFDAAIQRRPSMPEAHANRAKVLNDLKRSDEALASAERAIELRDGYTEAYNHRALALLDLRLLDEALAACDATVALDPTFASARNNRGITLFDHGRLPEALVCYDEALALDPDFCIAHLNRAASLLALGDLKHGFQEYDWRWNVPGSDTRSAGPWPEWRGEDLAGKTILIHGEQGFGDRLQFSRFAPMVAATGAVVTLKTEPGLVTLFKRSMPELEVVARLPPDAAYDVQVPLMSLPKLFGTTLETVPSATPYLVADLDKTALWSERLAGGGGLKVGLVWAGDGHRAFPTLAATDRRRSIALARYAPLAGVEGITFVSLQKGEPATQAVDPPAGMALVDLTADLRDFDDTAALIANLDLVISVDTAVAHLAGALGKPVWILSRFAGCWRWLDGREDSPWYPTARLFHQHAPGDWDEVMTRVSAALADFASAGR
ncbi:MAG TPA: tetratricopeptide repeat protein [Caulobacteraceae bacterium]|jgi:tetratricopeptide (TPR) repeat protein